MTTTPKIGTERFDALVHKGQLEYHRHVLRTIHTRHGIKYGYMVQHIHGVTWIKLSKKIGHWGYAKTVDPLFRTKFRIENGLPYSATKLGALAEAIKTCRSNIESYGSECILWDEEGEISLGEELEILLRAQKRMRGKK